MRIRHRIPTVFSLYMVDVLCCALGCVILMWLTNLQASEDQSQEASNKLAEANKREAETVARLKDAEQRAGNTSHLLKVTAQERDAAYLLLADLNQHLEKREAEKKDLEKNLLIALALSKDLEETLKDKSGRVVALEKDLAAYLALLKETQATAALVPNLRTELKTTKDKLAEEAALALALEKEISKRMKELADLNKSLADLRDTKSSLEKTVDARDKDLAAARVYKTKWEAAEERLQLLEKQMTERQKELALAELNAANHQKEKKSLLDEMTRVRGAAEARFAGIQLTGKRVVFLVDMSGSMDLTDETTAAPTKWLGVRETLVKLMRSLPELDKFQVILFSEKPWHVLGEEGWIDYDPRTSSDRVFKAMAETKPKGGTNMYAALETTFKLREKGLDTIYLLSDGLPNMGEGLKPEEMTRLTEMQRGDVLGKFIRRKLRTDWNRALVGQPAVRINTVGFFYESPDVGAFLWALARENDGSFVGMSKP